MTEDQYTNQTSILPVGDGHELWVHDWGNKKAKTPIFFLHGGPGSQCKDKHKFPFDGATQRVIFHDQRGSGQSVPTGELKYNTTQELASDITKIADHLGITTFIITGGSWGSTLALYYALENPDRVEAVVVSGVYTGSQSEIDWMDKGLFRTHFPDVWDNYVTTVPAEYKDDPTAYHMANMIGDNEEKKLAAARAYGDLEAAIISLNDFHAPTPETETDLSGNLLEMYYLANRCFLPDRYILDAAYKLTMPLHIVQGRYDFVCPPTTAYELSKRAPNTHCTFIQAGHAAEHETTTALSLIYHQLTA